jgi:hypothetical protein
VILEHSPAEGRFRTPKEASEYLRSRHGIIRAVPTLARLRCLGGGPAFHKLGGKYVGYTDPALDDYANKIIGPELRSTSEAA